jgi:ABC-type Zn uptake system ZnuABC Zn-binding protein ZnuA/ABC-type Mn2+/Zn2+ transport system permease subunit
LLLLYARAVLESLDLPFVQRGLAEVLLLSVGAGLIGSWVVLRGLAFHSHAVGTAAFPGLVLAEGLGFAAALGALGAAAVFAVLVALLTRGRANDRGSEVALVLVGMLALGVILASDVFDSSAALDTLLFGSLLLIDGGDLALAAAVSAAALVAAAVAGRHWVAHGFDAEGEGTRIRWLEPALLGLVALATAAAVTAVGALLVTALFVIPAATTRLWTSRMRPWQLATVALCAVEGVAGVLLSVELNAPPGATIALLGGLVFAVAAVVATARRHGARPGRPLARWAAAGASIFLIAGCGSDDGAGGDGGSVVATTPIVGDLVGNVAGDDVEVTTLLAANTDPHEYEPRPDDIEALASAGLVVASGGDLDAWIADAIDDSGSGADLLVLADGIPHELHGGHTHHDDEHAEEEEHAAEEELDPHWWHDPRNAAATVAAIGEALAGLDSEAASAIEERAADYGAEIEAADAAIAKCLEAVPAADRKLVTDHDAFGYLAERYDVEIVGAVIPATTTEAQSSAGELAELRDLIEAEDVGAVFPEASVTTDLAQTIASETGASADYELYGDTLGPDDSTGATYLDLIGANADALVRGFTGGVRGCQA